MTEEKLDLEKIAIKSIKDNNKLFVELDKLITHTFDLNEKINTRVDEILDLVKIKGDKALIELNKELDGASSIDIKSLSISKDEMAEAWENIDADLRKSLMIIKERVTAFCEMQKRSSWQMAEDDGSILGQIVSPIESVGLYVPGGSASYPSSVLMSTIPAKVAGVPRVVVSSPAMNGSVNDAVLAAAFLCEVDEFYKVGGAQAIAALAYGTETIKKVDKIVGPGNAYVVAAKQKVFGRVSIDMLAGPSEIVIISDGSCNPEWIVADMFAQAEHDENSQAILITTSKEEVQQITKLIPLVLEKMPRKEIIIKSLLNRGAIIHVESLSRAAEVSNFIAPEHLELLTNENDMLIEKIKHAGAIFVGAYSCEALGDYIAGANHILPTSKSARFSSPLGVSDFQKSSNIVKLTNKKSQRLARHANKIATEEGLFAHALASKLRENDLESE